MSDDNPDYWGGDFRPYEQRLYADMKPRPEFNEKSSTFRADAITAKNHPLAKYVDPLPGTLTATEFVIDGAISAGMVMLAGGWGAGKTSQLIPLMTRAAHLCKEDDPLRPKLRRRVIYITEDIKQAQLILKAMHENGEFGECSPAEVAEYFKCVSAERMRPKDITIAADAYSSLITVNKSEKTGNTYHAKPVIVIDTRSAVIELEDENSNTEAGDVIATMRQGFPGYPIIIVGHLAKSLKRADTRDMSGRGAGAWEADVQQVLYLASDGSERFLDVASPKHRFASSIDGLTFSAVRKTFIAQDVLGEDVEEVAIYGQPTIVALGGREERKQEAEQERKQEAVKEMRGSILDITRKWKSRHTIINRASLGRDVTGRKEAIVGAINDLVDEGWLHELSIPAEYRDNPNAGTYIIGLTPEERKVYQASNTLPEGSEIPKTEKAKRANPSVPDKTGGAAQNAEK